VIKHIVMWTLADEALGATKAQNMARIKTDLEALRGCVPGLRHLEVGINFEPSDAAYDMALYSEFDDTDALAAYQAHPDHQAAAAFIGQVRTGRVVADYEV
jgi:hypothetical protein